MTRFYRSRSTACGCETCPPDLCCFSECHCSPPLSGGRRLTPGWLAPAAAAAVRAAAHLRALGRIS